MSSRDEMGWTSSEVLIELKDKWVIRTDNFSPGVKPIFREKGIQEELGRILNTDIEFSQLLKQIRYMGNVILDGLLAKDTDTLRPEPKLAFFWQGDPGICQKINEQRYGYELIISNGYG